MCSFSAKCSFLFQLADAYEEVEEQRQVVGQWKRKVQKLNGEMNDLRHLLEEQNARNNLLEKKQRKFDTETQLLQDELKKERQIKERFSREKEVCMAEKYAIETSLAVSLNHLYSQLKVIYFHLFLNLVVEVFSTKIILLRQYYQSHVIVDSTNCLYILYTIFLIIINS